MNKVSPEYKMSFSKDTTVSFWLPPQDSATHIAVVIGGKQPEIYINGTRQPYEEMEYILDDHTPNDHKLETQPDTEQLIDEAIEGYKLDTDDEPDTKGGVQSVPTLEPDNKLIPVWRRLGENDPKPANGQWIQVATPGIYAFEFDIVRVPDYGQHTDKGEGATHFKGDDCEPKVSNPPPLEVEPDTAIDSLLDNKDIFCKCQLRDPQCRYEAKLAIREMVTEAENQAYEDGLEKALTPLFGEDWPMSLTINDVVFSQPHLLIITKLVNAKIAERLQEIKERNKQ